MTLKARIIPCLDVKDGQRRPQRLCREDAQNGKEAVRC
jgi:imidazole glycerol phosphate synthase subunit HisF